MRTIDGCHAYTILMRNGLPLIGFDSRPAPELVAEFQARTAEFAKLVNEHNEQAKAAEGFGGEIPEQFLPPVLRLHGVPGRDGFGFVEVFVNHVIGLASEVDPQDGAPPPPPRPLELTLRPSRQLALVRVLVLVAALIAGAILGLLIKH
jgi:hypothetical protein